MISLQKEERIRFLLKEGLSNREIARKVGVARQTIAAIKKLRKLRKRRILPIKLKKLKKSRRCEICGGKVKIWPCLLCHPESGYYDERNVDV